MRCRRKKKNKGCSRTCLLKKRLRQRRSSRSFRLRLKGRMSLRKTLNMDPLILIILRKGWKGKGDWGLAPQWEVCILARYKKKRRLNSMWKE
jgi:hypothetical protein